MFQHLHDQNFTQHPFNVFLVGNRGLFQTFDSELMKQDEICQSEMCFIYYFLFVSLKDVIEPFRLFSDEWPAELSRRFPRQGPSQSENRPHCWKNEERKDRH